MVFYRKLLLDRFERELKEDKEALREFDDSLVCDKYDLDTINCLVMGEAKGKFSNLDVFRTAREFLNNNSHRFTKNDKDGLLAIINLNYLFDSRAVNFNEFCEMYMRLHLEKDRLSVYRSGFKGDITPYSISLVEKMDSINNTTSLFCGVDTVIQFLNYIDYERSISSDDQYVEALDSIYKEFYNYLAFYTSPSDISRFDQSRGEGLEFQATSNKDNLNLIKFYLRGVPTINNSFCQFREIEKLLCSGNELELKEHLLCAFAYRKYDGNDEFFKVFKDVLLTDEDLIKFIRKYEASGRILSVSQFGNIISNFRKRSLDVLGRLDEDIEFDKEVSLLYKEFFDDSPCPDVMDFIEYCRETLSSEFSRYCYERIIKGNLLYEFSYLMDSKSFDNYALRTGYKIEDDTTAYERYSREALKRREMYDKYYTKLFQHQYSTDETMGYFIRNNVLSEDLDGFNELFDWFVGSSHFITWNDTPIVYTNCADKLLEDFKRELEDGLFMDRLDIKKKYLKYASHDGVRRYTPPRMFDEILRKYTNKFFTYNSWSIFGYFCVRYSGDEDLASYIKEIGLSKDDALKIIDMVGSNGDCRLSEISGQLKEKLELDVVSLKEATKKTRSLELEKMYGKVLRDYIDSPAKTVKDYCELTGTDRNLIIKAVSYYKGLDNDLYHEYREEKARIAATRYQKIDARDIVDKIENGVVLSDGSKRAFNYLDFRRETDISVDRFIASCRDIPGITNERLEYIGKYTENYAYKTYYNEGVVLGSNLVVEVDGELREVTLLQKVAALDYIKSLSLPKENAIFDLVVKEIVSNEVHGDAKAGQYVKKSQDA